MKKKINLNYQLFLQKEEHFFHQPYNNELNFYNAIKQGNIEFIEESKRKYANTEKKPAKPDGKGVLSKNPVRNELYHFITNVAIITRNCIEEGLLQEDAYTLSDLYIQAADQTNSVSELMELNDQMVREFTLKMRDLQTNQVISKKIKECITYIYNHLHEHMTTETISKTVDLNPCYLSTLFKKETGNTLHAFIQNKRLETAKNMLRDSNYSSSDIAATLCFSSQSHFIKLFRQKYSLTPGEFRRQ